MLKVKVCGITGIEQAKLLTEMNVDYVGFIGYSKSPRYAWSEMKPNELASLNQIQKVGVFVNELPGTMAQIVKEAKLDYVQLHGNESADIVRQMAKYIPVIKAISIGENENEIQSKINELEKDVTYFLFDTATKNYGGSGKKFNWKILNEIEIPKPYFLSGGIDSDFELQENQFNHLPFALDVNSKFETEPGVKDLEMVKKFITKI